MTATLILYAYFQSKRSLSLDESQVNAFPLFHLVATPHKPKLLKICYPIPRTFHVLNSFSFAVVPNRNLWTVFHVLLLLSMPRKGLKFRYDFIFKQLNISVSAYPISFVARLRKFPQEVFNRFFTIFLKKYGRIFGVTADFTLCYLYTPMDQ